MGALELWATQTIAGNFTQISAGVLGLDFAGEVFGQYGALSVSNSRRLTGVSRST